MFTFLSSCYAPFSSHRQRELSFLQTRMIFLLIIFFLSPQLRQNLTFSRKSIKQLLSEPLPKLFPYKMADGGWVRPGLRPTLLLHHRFCRTGYIYTHKNTFHHLLMALYSIKFSCSLSSIKNKSENILQNCLALIFILVLNS